jgi:hypothetical protein
MQRSVPSASAGLRMLPASMLDPVVAPAPTIMCSSSMYRMAPGISFRRLSTPLRRSSNCPRNLVPATSAPMSRLKTRALASTSGTCPAWMRSARPSAMAVLPTPGSPTSTGLFLRRRHSTCCMRSSSTARPISGSMRPASASAFRSVVYASRGSVAAAPSPSSSSCPSSSKARSPRRFTIFPPVSPPWETYCLRVSEVSPSCWSTKSACESSSLKN